MTRVPIQYDVSDLMLAVSNRSLGLRPKESALAYNAPKSYICYNYAENLSRVGRESATRKKYTMTYLICFIPYKTCNINHIGIPFGTPAMDCFMFALFIGFADLKLLIILLFIWPLIYFRWFSVLIGNIDFKPRFQYGFNLGNFVY